MLNCDVEICHDEQLFVILFKNLVGDYCTSVMGDVMATGKVSTSGNR